MDDLGTVRFQYPSHPDKGENQWQGKILNDGKKIFDLCSGLVFCNNYEWVQWVQKSFHELDERQDEVQFGEILCKSQPLSSIYFRRQPLFSNLQKEQDRFESQKLSPRIVMGAKNAFVFK
jgi:hypothetical protein